MYYISIGKELMQHVFGFTIKITDSAINNKQTILNNKFGNKQCMCICIPSTTSTVLLGPISTAVDLCTYVGEW